MNDQAYDKLKDLRIGDYIYGILIVVSLIGIYADKKEKEQYTHQDPEGRKKAHTARLIIFTIALLIYIYFLNTRIKKSQNATNKFLSHLDILATILFIIGGLIFLYDEYKGYEQEIIIE